MERSSKSKLCELNELLDQLRLSLKVNVTISSILAEYEQRIYNLEENEKMLQASYRRAQERLTSLEHRYSELLYRFSENRTK